MKYNTIYLSKIDDFFTKVFGKIISDFSFSSLMLLLTGIIIGILLTAAIYLIFFVFKIKKEEKNINSNNNVDLKEIEANIQKIKNNFVDSTDGLAMKEKVQVFSSTLYTIVNSVASSYYPNSKYPFFELSVEEIILFLEYLSKRLDDVFSKGILKPFRKLTVSQVFKILDAKKKIDENKIVKAAAATKPTKIFSKISMALNYANPIYWFKKVVINTTVNFTINKIFLLVIDIVADETNKTYSKSIFNQEKNLNQKLIEQTLKEINEE